MKLVYNGSKDREHYNKIHAIKIVRNNTGMGLKEAKVAVEVAVENGFAELQHFPHIAPPISLMRVNSELQGCGEFCITSDMLALTDKIEQAIELAVSLREYKTARALINTLPKELRTDHIGDTQE